MQRINLHEAVNAIARRREEMAPETVNGHGELIEVSDPDAIGGPRTYLYCLRLGSLDHEAPNKGLLSDVSILHRTTGRFEVLARGQGAEEMVETLEELTR